MGAAATLLGGCAMGMPTGYSVLNTSQGSFTGDCIGTSVAHSSRHGLIVFGFDQPELVLSDREGRCLHEFELPGPGDPIGVVDTEDQFQAYFYSRDLELVGDGEVHRVDFLRRTTATLPLDHSLGGIVRALEINPVGRCALVVHGGYGYGEPRVLAYLDLDLRGDEQVLAFGEPRIEVTLDGMTDPGIGSYNHGSTRCGRDENDEPVLLFNRAVREPGAPWLHNHLERHTADGAVQQLYDLIGPITISARDGPDGRAIITGSATNGMNAIGIISVGGEITWLDVPQQFRWHDFDASTLRGFGSLTGSVEGTPFVVDDEVVFVDCSLSGTGPCETTHISATPKEFAYQVSAGQAGSGFVIEYGFILGRRDMDWIEQAAPLH